MARRRPGLEPVSLIERRYWLFAAAVLAIAAWAYWPVLSASYHFDDYSLFSDPAVVSPSGPARLLSLERTRPVTYLTFWISFHSAHTDSNVDHSVNVLLHLSVIAFAAVVFRRMAPPAAIFGVVILALHPAASEAVAYVFARATLLAALFCAAAWLAWIARKYWLAVGLFVLALLAKEEAAGLPLFLAGYELFVRRADDGRRWTAPLTAMAVAVALAAARLYHAASALPGTGFGPDAGVGPWQYFWTQGRVIWLYVRLLAAPYGLNFSHHVEWSQGADVAGALGWGALAAAAGLCLRHARRWPELYWLVGGLLLLAPSSSIVPLADAAAERRIYLPLLSLALAGGMALARLPARLHLGAALVLALALASLTHQRASVWETERSLWKDVVAKSPDAWRPKLQLARALEAGGPATIDRRERLIAEARALSPGQPEPFVEEGLLRLGQERFAAALAAFDMALGIVPRDAQIHAYRGSALFLGGRLEDAGEAFRGALALDPCNFDARNNLILVERSLGRPQAGREAAFAPDDCPFTPDQHEALEAARRR